MIRLLDPDLVVLVCYCYLRKKSRKVLALLLLPN
jgi:hypothetical protein